MSASMRALVVTRPGGPEVLEVRERPIPEPGPGEIRIRVATSGVNRADILQRMGRYPAPPGVPPDVPGLEVAGTVDAVGDGARRWQVGDGVMGIVSGGGCAEFALSPAETAVRAPAGMELDEAGAIPEVFETAFDAALLQGRLRSQETLLVHAVGSGVGTATAQLGKAFGACVIGTSRTAEKLERVTGLGVDHAVPGDEQWPERVLEITDGRGADVILDLVGGPYLEGNQRVLASGGRHIVVGVTGGPGAQVDLRALMGKRGSIRGTVLRARSTEEKAALASSFEAHVVPGFEDRRFRPVIDRILPAEEAPQAHALLESNATFGKVLLKW